MCRNILNSNLVSEGSFIIYGYNTQLRKRNSVLLYFLSTYIQKEKCRNQKNKKTEAGCNHNTSFMRGLAAGDLLLNPPHFLSSSLCASIVSVYRRRYSVCIIYTVHCDVHCILLPCFINLHLSFIFFNSLSFLFSPGLNLDGSFSALYPGNLSPICNEPAVLNLSSNSIPYSFFLSLRCFVHLLQLCVFLCHFVHALWSKMQRFLMWV